MGLGEREPFFFFFPFLDYPRPNKQIINTYILYVQLEFWITNNETGRVSLVADFEALNSCSRSLLLVHNWADRLASKEEVFAQM